MLTTRPLTDAHLTSFEKDGYFILDKVLPADTLAMMQDECDRLVAKAEEEMRAAGETTRGITHLGKRYFLPHTYRASRGMHSFIFSELMAEICRATLGPQVTFFLDQLVVKASQKGLPFSWHQDSGYIPFDHEPYLTCWTALDDVTEENGTVYLLPYSHLGIRSRVTHTRQEGSNDMVGYFGDNPGVAVEVPAGSIAVFSSVCFHRSGPNTTDKYRRVMLTQYSKGPIINPRSQENHINGIDFLRDGKRVHPAFEG